MRSAPTKETCQGRRVPGGSQETRSTACRQDSGAGDAPGTAIAPARVGLAEPVTGHMRGGVAPSKLHSARLPKPGQAASVRGQSNQS